MLRSLSILPIILLLACGAPEERPTETVFRGETMGTYYSVKVASALDAAQQAAHAEAIEGQLDAVNQGMSTYLDDSELSRFNRAEATGPVQVSEDLYDVFQLAYEVSELTGGAYDITVGPLVNAWGFGPDGTPDAVDPGMIESLRQRIGFEKLELDPAARTLTKARGDLYCDLSSIAKGYAIDRVVQALAELGSHDVWVEVGGEVRAQGQGPGGRPWRLGIEKPVLAPGIVQRILTLEDMAVATSGDYRNYREVDGERVSHIIDPRTGYPIGHRLASVSVVHPTCGYADALATALLVMGDAEGFELAEREGLAALFLVRDGDGFIERATPAFLALNGTGDTP